MKVKAVFQIVLAMIVTSISLLALTPRVVQASADTILYLDPPTIVNPTMTPEDTFTADIMVSDVEYLYGWQINLSFNPAVLRITEIVEGDFLKDQPEGTWSGDRIENEEGWALFGEVTVGAYIGVGGSGTLAAVEFQVHGVGESPIKIETDPQYVPGIGWRYLTYLIQQLSINPPPNFNYLYPPDITIHNGYFSNFGAVHNTFEQIHAQAKATKHVFRGVGDTELPWQHILVKNPTWETVNIEGVRLDTYVDGVYHPEISYWLTPDNFPSSPEYGGWNTQVLPFEKSVILWYGWTVGDTEPEGLYVIKITIHATITGQHITLTTSCTFRVFP
jgi:hypothetical protein